MASSGGQGVSVTSHSADDGFGDPDSISNDGLQGSSARGHLIEVTGVNQFSRSFSIHASLSVAVAEHWYSYYGVSGYVSAESDLRGVEVGSDRDPTYYRVEESYPWRQIVRVVNERAHDGSLKGDVAKPVIDPQFPLTTGTTCISYGKTVYGNWSTGSSFAWQMQSGSLTSGYLSGTFVPDDIPNITAEYGTTASDDAITLKLIDSYYNVRMDASYSVKFHDPIGEDWHREFSNQHPLPFVQSHDPLDNHDWNQGDSTTNNGTDPMTWSISFSTTTTDSVNGTIELTQGMTIPINVVTATLGAKEGVTIGEQVSGTVTVTITETVPAGYTATFYWAKSYEDRSGDQSCCDFHGFSGATPWNVHIPHKGPNGKPAIATYVWVEPS